MDDYHNLYNPAANKCLRELYVSNNVTTDDQIIALLDSLLGGKSNFYPTAVKDSYKRRALEMQYLTHKKLITPELY